MGFNAELFIFDHAAYEQTFRPTHHLVLEKRFLVVDMLSPFEHRRRVDAGFWDLEAPEAACPYFESSSLSCEREMLLGALAATCLGKGVFIGRSVHPESLRSTVQRRWKLGAEHRLSQLLDQLGIRSILVQCELCYQIEGPQGWLDPEETTELAELLAALPLPEYEPRLALVPTLQQALQTWNNSEHDGMLWDYFSLAFVRTVARLASHLGNGLLWSHDYAIWSEFDPRKVLAAPDPTLEAQAIRIIQRLRQQLDAGPIVFPMQPAQIQAYHPELVYRDHPDPTQRTLVLFGHNFPLFNHGLQFRNTANGEHSLIFDIEVHWESTTRISFDVARISDLLWPAPQLELQARIIDTSSATYDPLSAWSEPFFVQNIASE